MTEISALVGQQIRECRKKRNMTLEDMAGLIGKSRSTISKYEKGEIPVDMETLYMIARTLEAPIEQFLYTLPATLPHPARSGVSPSFFHGISKIYSIFLTGGAASCPGCRVRHSL